jgi:hypothetical protein
VDEALDITLPCDPQSARRARQELEPFRKLLDQTRFGDLRLLVSELVAEAIGGLGGSRSQTIRLRARSDTERVWVSVEEAAATYFVPSTRPEPGGVGWSVYLVQRLSDCWGVRRNGEHASVWLEIGVEPRKEGNSAP